MGFTFSHPALVIPFKYLPRKWYSATGLIVGSMVPDFEYFIRIVNQESNYSHTILGVFWFDIPLAIIISVAFHVIIRDPLISNLPAVIKSRFTRYLSNDWVAYAKKNWIIVLSSIFIGIMSHLFWDSFTAINGYFVKATPFFLTKYDIGDRPMYFYKILKHLSSLVGMLFVLHQLYIQPKTIIVKQRIDAGYWILFVGISVIFTLLLPVITPIDYTLNTLIKKFISSVIIALFVSSIYFRKKSKSAES